MNSVESYNRQDGNLTAAGIGCPATGGWGLRSAGLILYCWARCIGTADMPCAGIPMADGITTAIIQCTHESTLSPELSRYFWTRKAGPKTLL